MSFFVSNVEGELLLTTAGKIALVAILAVLLIGAAAVAAKAGNGKKVGTKQLVFCAMAMALATVTSMIKVYEFPFGGSITLCSMLFICLIGWIYGPVAGVLTGFSYGVMQFLMGPYILTPIQVLVDYPLAFGALGLAGVFRKAKHGLVKGYVAGILGRYVFAVISGWIFFGEYAWEGWNPFVYSLAYNGAYVFSEGAMTVLVLLMPAVSKGLLQIKVMANE